MQVKEKDDRYMHGRLPIGSDEKILAIYKHHWFAYASLWMVGVLLVVCIFAVAGFLISGQDSSAGAVDHSSQIIAIAGVFATIIALGTFVPVYLRSQEQVVLTQEALLQILQPSLFANKISQLNLQHIADVSVRQDVLGTIFGYGKISVETPGEQDNYEFIMIPRPQAAAKEIIEAHENFQAALESGRMPTTLGGPIQGQAQQTPVIDPQQYQQFLAYQQMVAQQQADATQAAEPTLTQDSSDQKK